MSLRSGKLPFLGSEDEFFYHTGTRLIPQVFVRKQSELPHPSKRPKRMAPAIRE
jgi:hypothetical protein